MDKKEVDRQTIDSLKGIGILSIILVHYELYTSNHLISGIVFQGARGVQLMYIVNSFLIFSSLSRIKLCKKEILCWWKKKFLRLIPMYYFFTILFVIIYGRQSSYYLGKLTHITLPDILANLLFLHGLYPYYINSININWFMADLAIFYLLAPLLFKFIDSIEKSYITLVIAIIVQGCFSRVALQYCPIEVRGIWDDYVNIIGFSAEFPVMLLGILAYFIYTAVIQKKLVQNKKIVSFVGIFFCVFMWYSIIGNRGYFIIDNNILSAAIILFIFFLSQLLYQWKIFNNKLLALFGKHSYGIYLSHLFIIRLLSRYEISGNAEIIYIRILGYFFAIFLALVISIFAERVIERPIQKIVLK